MSEMNAGIGAGEVGRRGDPRSLGNHNMGPRSILVKLDGSPYSHVATELAIQWATQYGAKLLGISVVDEESILTPFAEEPQSVTLDGQETLRQAIEIAEQYLEEFERQCRQANVEYSIGRERGRTADRILREVQRHDLVILGRELQVHSSHFPNPDLKRLFKYSPRPVVTVPLSLPRGQSILVAYDASPSAARALGGLLHSGLVGERQVHVVTVRKSRAAAADDASLAEDYLSAHGIRVIVHAMDSHPSLVDSIMACVGGNDIGMLVAGVCGRSLASELFLGSNTTKIVRYSPVPVFLIH